MGNALSRIAASIFNSRKPEQTQDYGTRQASASPSMLGTGLASNAASGLLAKEYQTRAAIAQANGEEMPSFEEWVLSRR